MRADNTAADGLRVCVHGPLPTSGSGLTEWSLAQPEQVIGTGHRHRKPATGDRIRHVNRIRCRGPVMLPVGSRPDKSSSRSSERIFIYMARLKQKSLCARVTLIKQMGL